MEDTKDNGIIETEEEVIDKIDPTKYKLVKQPSEKQVKARLEAGARLKKIFALKKIEKERIMKETETKLVADLKEKWKKEHAEEEKKKVAVKPSSNLVSVPKSMIEKDVRKKRVVVKKRPAKKEETDDETDEEDSDDDHIPQTDCESTDTRTIKKKLAKVKQIEAVVSNQKINPYLSMLEKYYK